MNTQIGHTEDINRYLNRLYRENKRLFACHADSPEKVLEWQQRARPALCKLIGLDRIQEDQGNHQTTAELEEPDDMGEYTRQLGVLHSEAHVNIPFWFLKPKTDGPFPLGIFPHGHSKRGFDTYVGIYHDEETRLKIEREERDVAVQAVRNGFVAIAPTTRGFEPAAVPDINGRHGDRDCRSQLMHCLLAGRTSIGERVWDTQKMIDWATSLPYVDSDRILMMGNSGGGVVTIYASACDTRVTVSVPSCSFCTFVGKNGLIHHCDCNAVPGILNFGEFWDVAGLIAPRHLCIVNGKQDPLFPIHEVDRAVEGVGRIYDSAGVPERFAHHYGEGGHRFYRELMWPSIHHAIHKVPGV
ncbi:dienelactone hydrolase family protein [Candidatus Poribacteria bacterium]